MGSCFSCCRRRKPATGEREPLLPKATEYVPPKAAWDKVADALGALSAGKMPTQQQIDTALGLLLSSDMLKVGATSTGALSAHGKLLVLDVREIVQAVARIGMEKNVDNLIQDVMWQYRCMSAVPVQVDANWHNQSKLDIDVDEAVNHLNEIPSVDQGELVEDSQTLAASLRNLVSLFLTSSGFRLIISDILITTREILADTASDVAAMAAYVETKAENIEETVRPDPQEGAGGITIEDAMNQADKVEDSVKSDLEHALKEAEMRKHVIEERLAKESPDRVKQTIVERIEVIVQQAQSNPAYKASLQTIVTLAEKYTRIVAQTTESTVEAAQSAVEDSTVQPSASVNPIIETDPHLKQLLQDVRTLFERFAGGHSLSPLADCLKTFLVHLSRDDASGVSDLLRDVKAWLNKGLETPGWITTRPARSELDALYDRTKTLLDSKPPWRVDLQNASIEASAFSDDLKRDAATQQLLGAIDTLGAHTRALSMQAVRSAGYKQLRADLWRDAIGWLLPRVLSILKAVPLPRVEMKSNMIDAVVDDVTFRGPSFIPDHFRVENWSEVRVQGSDAVYEDGEARGRDWLVEGDSTLRVHLDGLRITAHEIAYFFHLKTALLGYRDNGLLSVDVGHRASVGEGMNLDLTLETDLDPSSHAETGVAPPSFFRVKSATVDVPGLDFTLARTHHWLLNALAQPLLGPVVRAGMRMALSQSVKAGLEALDRKAGEVYAQAKQQAGAAAATDQGAVEPSIWDWLNAFMKGQSSQANGKEPDTDSSSEEDEDEVEEPEAQTETQVTTKGVIVTTHQPATENQSESETILAVGVAEQILPGLGGPEDGAKAPEVVERARDAAGEVQEAADHVAEGVAEVRKDTEMAAGDAQNKAVRATERMKARRDAEIKKKGWKSKAFDF